MCGNCNETPLAVNGKTSLEQGIASAKAFFAKALQEQGIEPTDKDVTTYVAKAVNFARTNDPVLLTKTGVVLAKRLSDIAQAIFEREAKEEAKAALKDLIGESAKADQTSVLVRGSTNVTIKPFATLDDAMVSAGKVAKLVYPEFAGEDSNDLNYLTDLLRAASKLNVVEPEQRYEALIDVLGLVLMGFDSSDIDSVKEVLNERLAKAAEKEVNEQTKAFLKDTGFIYDLNA